MGILSSALEFFLQSVLPPRSPYWIASSFLSLSLSLSLSLTDAFLPCASLAVCRFRFPVCLSCKSSLPKFRKSLLRTRQTRFSRSTPWIIIIQTSGHGGGPGPLMVPSFSIWRFSGKFSANQGGNLQNLPLIYKLPPPWATALLLL